MTYQDDFTLSAALLAQGSLEQLSAQGLGALPDLFPVLLNAVMQIERQNTWEPPPTCAHRSVRAMPMATKKRPSIPDWDRSPSPSHKCAKSMEGGGFYPQSLERGTRSELARNVP